MAAEPKLHQVGVGLTMDGVVTVQTEVIIVSTLKELQRAVAEKKRNIIFSAPDWLHPPKNTLLYNIFIGMLALVMWAVAHRYNVEFGPKIVLNNGTEISFPIKLTKP